MTKLTRSGPTPQPPGDVVVVSKAVVRAADRLGVSNRTLPKIVGLSESSVSRMKAGEYALEPRHKAFELGLVFVRLFRSLDTVVGGDEVVARAWLRNENHALGGVPLKLIETVWGLTAVLAYLAGHRTLV